MIIKIGDGCYVDLSSGASYGVVQTPEGYRISTPGGLIYCYASADEAVKGLDEAFKPAMEMQEMEAATAGASLRLQVAALASEMRRQAESISKAKRHEGAMAKRKEGSNGDAVH